MLLGRAESAKVDPDGAPYGTVTAGLQDCGQAAETPASVMRCLPRRSRAASTWVVVLNEVLTKLRG